MLCSIQTYRQSSHEIILKHVTYHHHAMHAYHLFSSHFGAKGYAAQRSFVSWCLGVRSNAAQGSFVSWCQGVRSPMVLLHGA
jgi:hypothetical protein